MLYKYMMLNVHNVTNIYHKRFFKTCRPHLRCIGCLTQRPLLGWLCPRGREGIGHGLLRLYRIQPHKARTLCR